jgi:hypothetical protein
LLLFVLLVLNIYPSSNSFTWTIKARDTRRITEAEMNYMRRRAGYTWTDKNFTSCKGIKNNTDSGKLLE